MIITSDRPSMERLRSSSIHATVATASSMICVTSLSTSSGAAPGYATDTVTDGRSSLGKREMPSWG